MKKIGLSLSCCVRDIVRGEVKIEDVQKIVAGTKARSSKQWAIIFKENSALYWDDNPKLGLKIARQLLREGRVVQPRLRNPHHYPMIHKGHWVEKMSDIAWSDR